MSTQGDLATLSSIVAQVDDLGRRITEMAERYGETPDSAVATELASARRTLDRAMSLLDQAGD